MRTKILFEDEDILVCYKPAGIAVQSASLQKLDMVSELKKYLYRSNSVKPVGKGEPYLGVVHRLDQPVAGLIVFAKNSRSAAKLSEQAASKKGMKKIYHAEVYGHLDNEKGELRDYLLKDGKTNTSGVISMDSSDIMNNQDSLSKNAKVCNQGKNREIPKLCVLRYQVLECREKTDLVEIQLESGRHHQIRVQFSHAGYPLVGDQKYGSEESIQYSEQENIRNVSLEAVLLGFHHPTTGQWMEYTK